MRIPIDVAPGELLDKLTILMIKSDRIIEPDKLANIRRERAVLEAARLAVLPDSPELAELERELRRVNERLWEIEDALRAHEGRGDFGAGFVDLARAVYRNNDERARLKRRINELLGSDIAEEKSYTAY